MLGSHFVVILHIQFFGPNLLSSRSAPPVTIVGNTGTPEHHTLMTGDDLVLSCELSRPNFKVRWLRNDEELVSGGRVKITSRGVHRQLTIQSLRPSDSGTYTCDAGTDQLRTEVHVEGKDWGHVWTFSFCAPLL